MAKLTATAFSPATVGNVASGFDLVGHTIDGLGDTVTAEALPQSDSRPRAWIENISGVVTDLPKEADLNTASRAVSALLQASGAKMDIALTIQKGIPLGSGLGGSAASATAALVATNALLPKPVPPAALYPHALFGEAIASGQAVGDNVGPQLLGGLVLATPKEIVALPVPEGLTAVVIHPDSCIHTTEARACLHQPFELNSVTRQQASLAKLITGLYQNNFDWIRQGLEDHLIEPRRKHLIPGFDEVQATAIKFGALGGSISGAGPAVFAWFDDPTKAEKAKDPMARVFEAIGLQTQAYVSPVSAPGARLVKLS